MKTYNFKSKHDDGDLSSELVGLVREMLKIFNRVDISDNGREFHPTMVQSCRMIDSERLREIFIRMDRLTRIKK